jgi:hypothetical protein
MMSDPLDGAWRFRCKICGTFGRGDKSLAHYMAMRHDHNYVEVWKDGSTSRQHVPKSEHRGKGVRE